MTTDVRRNDERSRYELYVGDQLTGIADFRVEGRVVVFPHTQIDPSQRGNGLGAQLVQAALDDARASGRSVIARCWYVAQFIDEHPEYRDLLAA
jgi:uncharacterized protein